MRKNVFLKNKKAFSLIEMLLVIGVLAVLLVAALVAYPRVRDAMRVNLEVKNLNMVKANVMTIYQTTGGNYNGVSTITINRARGFPETMNGGDFTVGSNNIKSSWGGNVEVVASEAITVPLTLDANRSFKITYQNVPQSLCLDFVVGSSLSFSKITVEGTDVIKRTANGAEFDPNETVMQCSSRQESVVAFYSL